MVKCAVIADDLTGANATGVMLKKQGYVTSTIMNLVKSELSNLGDCECIAFTTDSRGVDGETAYNRVYNLTKMLTDLNLTILCKRIDSTLRGNLGCETDAALDAMGPDYVAVVVPCAPASGRITVGGYMQVNGTILNKTEVALDPKTPIHDAQVAELFLKQTKYRVASLYMKDLSLGKDHLVQKIKEYAASGTKIIICDAITQEDIDLLSDSVIASGIKFIAVDPGAFIATLTQKMIIPGEARHSQKILTVVGSVNPVAKVQMENLWLSQPVYNVFVKTKQFLEGEEARQAEIDRVVQDILSHGNEGRLFSVTGDGINPENRLNFKQYSKKLKISVDDVSDIINQSMADIAYNILKADDSFTGLYASGGDVTAAVCKKCNAVGLNLIDEVIPLAACGSFMKGDFPHKLIVTKGGMTGDPDAINTCIARLKTLLNM